MGDPAKADPGLPPEIASAMEAAGVSPEVPKLMEIIEAFAKAKAEAKASPDAEPVERKWPLMKLPVDVDYQKALRAAKSGQLEATKVGGRWFCTERAMAIWLAKTGQGGR